MLASLYNGSVCVWNHETQVMALVVPYYEMFITDRCVSSVEKLNLYKNLQSLPLTDCALLCLSTKATVSVSVSVDKEVTYWALLRNYKQLISKLVFSPVL